MKQVNAVILPALGLDATDHNISEGTAQWWLGKLGYELKEAKKGIYIDGHEREDVVTYHKEFLAMFGENERLQRTYTDDSLEPVEPQLGPGEQLHILVMHDESIVHANELRRQVYVCDGKMPLRKKGQGRAIHISDFIVKENAGLPMDHQLKCTDTCEIIYPGKNNDGFWTNEKLVKQVKKAIVIFEYMYPNSVAEFVFDQSSAHGAFAKDALNAKEMNVRPGGKQWLMHNTFIPMDNPNPDLHGKPQAMVFPPDLPPHHPDFEFHGQVKGMQHILKECGLISVLEAANGGKVVRECSTCKLSREVQEQLHWEALATAEGADEPGKSNLDMLQESLRTDCCMQKMLANQQDFKDEKPLILILIEEAGHRCWFLPKFHCELNPIEMYWGWMKVHECFCTASDGTFLTTKCLVPQILDDCPVKTIHAFFRKTWHYMDAYRKGLNACQAEFAVKKYKSHGHCGPMLIMSIGVLLN
ncbi:hypothetical protein M404DRAFT_16178 [Pisolithus tinctorius Marx 270]|uniref:Uncharacterized protein n=1 Tax=Pisolithus tinctorius Marx 270 TaxID=870435 RepID=A0A0C3P3H4_PISTI|nr:hypothetical protein M404DRAFT_16178 [Pisolithus tinctorius Marx 270]